MSLSLHPFRAIKLMSSTIPDPDARIQWVICSERFRVTWKAANVVPVQIRFDEAFNSLRRASQAKLLLSCRS